MRRDTVRANRISLCVCAAGLLCAVPQYGQISAPLLGWTASGDGTAIEPVIGVLGSASVGSAIALPVSAKKVFMAPGQGWALADDASGGLALVKLGDGAVASYALIVGATGGADFVSFSPKGTAAVLGFKTAGVAEIVKGLDGSAAAAQVALPNVGANAVELAVSDAGDLLAGLFDDGSVYQMGGGSALLIARAGAPAGISFLAGQASLAVADGANQVMSVFDGIGGKLALRTQVSIAPMAGSNALVASSADGNLLLAAGAGDSRIVRVNLGDLSAGSIAVAAPVTRIERFGAGNEYLLGGGDTSALWILSGGGAELQTSFAQPAAAGVSSAPVAGIAVDASFRVAGRNK